MHPLTYAFVDSYFVFVIIAFIAWEQSLRRNFTDGIWQPNPTELVGVWELVDVAGQVA